MERPTDLDMIANEKIDCYTPDPKKRGPQHIMGGAHREASVFIRRQREGRQCGRFLWEGMGDKDKQVWDWLVWIVYFSSYIEI